MSVKKEVRFSKNAELRTVGNKLRGYAVIWDATSENLGGFVETVRKGAFRKSLSENTPVVCLLNHDPNHILGKSPGTLSIEEDNTGLLFEVDLPNTSDGQTVRELVKRGDLSGCSFSFQCVRDAWPTVDKRELLECTLADVSVVLWPAYPQTEVMVRQVAFPEGIPDELRAHMSDTRKVNPTYSTPPPSRPLAAKVPSFNSDQERIDFINQKLGVNPNSKRSNAIMNYPLSASQKQELRQFLLNGERRDITTSSGAAFVPEAFNSQIFSAMKSYDAIFSDAVNTTIETTTGAPFDLFALDDTESAATVVGEGVASDEQDPQGTYKTLLGQAPEWDTGIVKCSIALVQDAGIPIDQMLATAFGIRLARGIAPSLITSLLSASKLGTTATGDPNTSGATGATSIGYQDLIHLKKSIDPAYRASGKVYWLMNDNTLTALDSLTDKNGRPILPQTYVGGVRYLLGYPVGISPSLDDIGAGNKPVLFGATGFFVFRTVQGGGALIRLAERFAEDLTIGYKSHMRANGAVLCASGADSPVKYLQNAA